MPPDTISIEAFVNMSSMPLFPVGKSAYYLNHPAVSLQTWVDQVELNLHPCRIATRAQSVGNSIYHAGVLWDPHQYPPHLLHRSITG